MCKALRPPARRENRRPAGGARKENGRPKRRQGRPAEHRGCRTEGRKGGKPVRRHQITAKLEALRKPLHARSPIGPRYSSASKSYLIWSGDTAFQGELLTWVQSAPSSLTQTSIGLVMSPNPPKQTIWSRTTTH